MTVIGLTGGFGTGKTFVASVFRTLGAKIIDADKIAHGLLKKDTPSYKKIVNVFGAGILKKSGEIDRQKLARLVFKNINDLKRLNKILHPEIIRRIKKGIEKGRIGKDRGKNKGRYKSKDKRVVVIDAPLLIEAGLASSADKIIVVKCLEKVQIQRCRKKFRVKREEILKRIEKQLPIRKKMGMADFVIDNSRTRSRTMAQVRRVWKEIVWK